MWSNTCTLHAPFPLKQIQIVSWQTSEDRTQTILTPRGQGHADSECDKPMRIKVVISKMQANYCSVKTSIMAMYSSEDYSFWTSFSVTKIYLICFPWCGHHWEHSNSFPHALPAKPYSPTGTYSSQSLKLYTSLISIIPIFLPYSIDVYLIQKINFLLAFSLTCWQPIFFLT